MVPCAGNQMYDLDFKTAGNDGSKKLSGAALTDLYKEFLSKYPVMSIEDPFDQDDWATYSAMTADVGVACQVCVVSFHARYCVVGFVSLVCRWSVVGLSCRVVSCRVVSCRVVSCRVVSRRILSLVCHWCVVGVSCRCCVVSCRVVDVSLLCRVWYHAIENFNLVCAFPTSFAAGCR